MEHRAKSILLIILLIALVITISLFANFNEGITGGTIAKSIACYQDSDCSDGIKETEDLCRNPGTEYSLCVNKP